MNNILFVLIFIINFNFIFSIQTLKLGTLEYAPYIYKENDTAKGEISEMLDKVFNEMGYQVEYYFYPWARTLELVKDGKLDGVFTIKKTPSRELEMIYPKEYLVKQDYVFFTSKDSKISFNGDFNSIKNYKIGVINATSYGEKFDTALAKGVLKNIDYANNYKSTFQKLIANRVDIVICSKLVGQNLLKELDATNKIVIIGQPVETAYSYIAFNKNNEMKILAEKFSKLIVKYRK